MHMNASDLLTDRAASQDRNLLSWRHASSPHSMHCRQKGSVSFTCLNRRHMPSWSISLSHSQQGIHRIAIKIIKPCRPAKATLVVALHAHMQCQAAPGGAFTSPQASTGGTGRAAAGKALPALERGSTMAPCSYVRLSGILKQKSARSSAALSR